MRTDGPVAVSILAKQNTSAQTRINTFSTPTTVLVTPLAAIKPYPGLAGCRSQQRWICCKECPLNPWWNSTLSNLHIHRSLFH